MQILEIIHPIMGFTKTGVPLAFLQVSMLSHFNTSQTSDYGVMVFEIISWVSFIQVGGRSLILFGIIQAEERLHDQSAVFWLFYFWSLAEVFRYPFYMLQIYDRGVYIITWLRYSAWILLYPLGIASECVIIFS